MRRRPRNRLRSDDSMVWRGYPKRRKRVRVNFLRKKTTDAFIGHAEAWSQSGNRMRWILAFAGSIGVLCVLVYGIFFSGYFQVRNIIVLNESAVPTLSEDAIGRYLFDVKGRNLFLVNLQVMIDDIVKRNLRIRSITAERILPDALRIVVEEYPIVAHLWQGETNANALVNEAGFVVALINNPQDYGQYVSIKAFDARVWKEDTRAIVRDDLVYIIDAVQSFENQFGIEIERADYYEPNREVHLVTVQGFEVWFDFSRSVPESIADLILAFNEARIADDAFSSVDVRIPGKIFVCRRSGSCLPATTVPKPPIYSLPEESDQSI